MILNNLCSFSSATSRQFRNEWLFFAGILTVVGIIMVYSLINNYQENRQREQQRLSDQVRVIHDNLVRHLGAINRALLHVRNELPRWHSLDEGMARARSRLKAFVDAMPSVRTMLITDAQGRVIASNHDNLIGVDFHERSYFQTPLQYPSTEQLYVGEPFKTVLKVFVMNLVRMIPDAHGQFNGVVSASLNPEEFDTLLSSVRYAPDMWTAIAHGDGHLFMMVPPRPDLDGLDLAQPDSMFIKHRLSEETATVMVGKVFATSQAQRMIAQRTLRPPQLNMDKALIIAASRDLHAIDAPIWERGRLFAGLLSLLIITTAPLLCWSQRRRYLLTLQISGAQQALQEASIELEHFFNLSPDLICIKDRQQRILKLNPSWERILAYPQTELQSVHFLDLVHPDDTGATLTTILDLPSGQAVRGFINRYRHRDGYYLTLEWSASAKDSLIYATARDITEQRRNQQALADSERFLRTTLEVLPGKVAYWTHDLRCTFVNSAYAALLGKNHKEMYGAHFHELTAGSSIAEREPRLLAALEGHSQHFQQIISNPDQTLSYDWVHYIPDVVNGEVRGVFALISDITEIKEAQFKLEALNEELGQRTQQAEAANRYKSQFLANMSHEIRTPMNAVLGLLQLLQHTALTARQMDYAQKAQTAAEALLGILNDILDFSKIEADKIEIDQAPLQLEQLLGNLSVLLSNAVKDKNVEVLFDIGSDIPQTMYGDALRLQQVLLNLSGNAIKFTEEGEVVLALRVVERNEQQIAIQFTIRDTGIGIAPDKLESIFGLFTQAETSTTRRYGGTGLGLAISRRLVRLMGGNLSVSSELGHGSSFTFTLNFACPDANSIETHLLAKRKTALRVLIVDDNVIARTVLGETAKRFGWQVDVVESGVVALDKFQSTTPAMYDALFIDWKMPDMDGWETAKAINQLCGGRSAPLMIMVTARGRETLNERMASNPELIDGFLIKPVTPSMLFDSVVEATHGAAAMNQHLVAVDNVQRLRGLRLLLVEDNRLNQQVAKELLCHEGAMVEIAEDGEQGVDKVLHGACVFDAVLMDIQMPHMDGFTATRLIRGRLDAATLPIIAMTANAMSSDREECLAVGMNDHISKPIDLENLVATLRQHCAHAVPALELETAEPSMELPIDWSHIVTDLALPEALERLNNDRKLYARLARSVRGDQGTAVLDAQRLLQQGSVKEALVVIHTLKGVTATLGAGQVAQLAAELETQLKGGMSWEALQPLLNALAQALEQALNELERIAALWATPPSANQELQVEWEQVVQCLDALEQLLGERNMRALEAYAALQTALGEFQSAHLTALEQAMQHLDFAAALECCAQLRATL